jgi:hypothetical protein
VLTIVYQDKDIKTPEQIVWYVGEILPWLPTTQSILMVQADYKELAYIIKQTTVDGHPTIPVARRNGMSNSWYGDMAKFIFANVICK